MRSVTKLFPTLCNPINCSTSGFPVFHYLSEFAQTHVHCGHRWWYYLTISSSAALFSFCLQSFPVSGYFPMSWLFSSSGQSTGTSASASVLPRNSQDWFLLELTGLVSLQSKGLSRVFSITTVWKHQFYSASPSFPCYLTWSQTMVEVMQIMGTSFKRSHAGSAPNPSAVHCWPTPLLETPGHSWASLGQSLVESRLLSPGSWCAQGFACVLQESVSLSRISSCGSMVGLMVTSSKRA